MSAAVALVLVFSFFAALAPPSGAVVLGRDDFARTVQNGWGTSTSGHAWTVTGTPANWSVSNGAGLVALTAPAVNRTATMQGVSLRDVSLTATMKSNKAPVGATQQMYLRTRVVAGGAAYQLTVRLNPNRSLMLSLGRHVSGRLTTIAGPTVVPGLAWSSQGVKVRFETVNVSPTTLRARAWPVAAPEPATWLVTATDVTSTHQVTGSMAVGGFLATNTTNAPVQFGFDDLAAEERADSPPPPPPPPPVPAQPVPIPSTFGAVIGTTDYVPPAGAFYLSTSGSDSNNGSQAQPWRTLAHAAEVVPAGSTVVLRGGTYRERDVRIDQPGLTIQNYPGEMVWLSGSEVVTNWVLDGNDWRSDGWTIEFPRDEFAEESFNPAYPYAGWPDMVFVNATPLVQVGSRDQVIPGTFYVDYGADDLFVGTNPSGQTVEAATRPRALNVRSNGVTVRGIGVRHYGNTQTGLGAFLVTGNDATVENMVVEHNGAAGLGVFGDRFTIRRSTLRSNGLAGLHGNQLTGFVAESNWIVGNNAEHFAHMSAEAGLKLTAVADVRWSGNLSEGNDGNALWCDIGCTNVSATRNVLRNNARSGITFEISDGAILASNLSYGNGESGVYVLEATNVAIWNNTLHQNRRDIFVLEGLRSQHVQSVTIRNNVLSDARPTSWALLNVCDANNTLTAAEMGVTVDHNAYFRTTVSAPQFVATWANGSTSFNPSTFGSFQSTAGQEASGLYAEGPTNPFIANLADGDAGRPAGSPAHAAGASLPADVGAAVGVTAGQPVDIGVLVLG